MTDAADIDVVETSPGVFEPVDQDQGSVADLIAELRRAAADQAGAPQPIAVGTFAMYPTPDGGVMMVTNVDDGPLTGVQHIRIPAPLIRAVGALAGGGGRLGALRAMVTRNPTRKAIGGKST